MEQSLKKWLLVNEVYLHALKLIDSVFTAASCRYLLVKGGYLLKTGLLDQLPLRRMCDIDVIVDYGSLERVTGELGRSALATRVVKNTENLRPTESKIYLTVEGVDVLLEIQTDLNQKERFDLPPDRLFSRASPFSACGYLPAREDAVLIFVAHLLTEFCFVDLLGKKEELLVLLRNASVQQIVAGAREAGLQHFLLFLTKLFRLTELKVREQNASLLRSCYYGLCARLHYACGILRSFWFRRLFLEWSFFRNGIAALPSLAAGKYLPRGLRIVL